MEYNGYRISPIGTYAYYRIEPKKQGNIPDVLKGHFTSIQIAKQAIDNYLSSLITNKKGTANAKKESAGAG